MVCPRASWESHCGQGHEYHFRFDVRTTVTTGAGVEPYHILADICVYHGADTVSVRTGLGQDQQAGGKNRPVLVN